MNLFVGIKWKILIVSFLMLAIIFCGRTYSAWWFFKSQIEDQRVQRLEKNKIIWATSLNKSFNDLDRRLNTIPSLEGVSRALLGNKDKLSAKNAIDKSLENYWWDLEMQMGISGLTIFNASGGVVSSFGSNSPPQNLIKKAQDTNVSQYQTNCGDGCYLYVASPLLVEGENIGIAAAAINFSDAAIQFQAISGDDIFLIQPYKLHGKDKNKLWQDRVLAMTNRPVLLPLLIAQSNSLSDGKFYLASNTINLEENSYSVATIIENKTQNGSEKISPQIFIVSDITKTRKSFEQMFWKSVVYDGFGFLLLAVSLWFILLKPMNRLKKVSVQIPNLANNSFGEVRNALQEKSYQFRLQDESDMLSTHAVELANRLEAMQNQILERNAELEFQSSELQKERDFITALLNTAHAVIVMHDHTGRIILVNQHTCDLTGYDHSDLIGEKYTVLFDKNKNPPNFSENLDALLMGRMDVYQHEADLHTKSDQYIHMTWYYSTVPDPETSFNNILTIALDISARKKAEDHLGWLASHDTLTGVYNRRHFHQELEGALQQCLQLSQQGALLFIDLDHFKDVNDTSGHHVGDELLKRVARSLKECTRDNDCVGRFGGDEFAILLTSVTRERAEMVARRICSGIGAIRVEGEKHTHQGSCSVGVVMFPQIENKSSETAATLLADADIAMYHAKKTGRNNWCFYEDSLFTKEEAKERLFWDQLVKDSLEKDLLVIFYQPIMNIKKKQISHYECLLRIKNGNKLLPPVNFVKAAEESGLMSRIDEQVISLAFQSKKLMEMSHISCALSINLSGLSFQNSNLAFHIHQELAEYQINPKEIIFEITETSAVFDVKTSKLLMMSLKDMGFGFALDDFGAGFSTLAYIKQFPIDFIKIDGAFIKNIDTDLEDQILVKSIVDTARAFKLKTIAEFVENESSLQLLESIGVDYAQGYYIDKPKPFEEIWEIQVGDGEASFLPNKMRAASNVSPPSPN